MFGMSGTEMIIILVLALLLFGPNRLPEIAKMLGKGMREFNKATNDIRSTVESEFNKLAEIEPEKPKPAAAAQNVLELKPPVGAVAANEPAATPSPSNDAPAAPADPAGEKSSS
ncbi:MAG: twin-arginine translocase TatA/TatE family subunit [Deltaproteobacteria bacterium]|nr:twin-arginine translocase TatA/TatE family subunit [Deltaproteobacteria bacterium]